MGWDAAETTHTRRGVHLDVQTETQLILKALRLCLKGESELSNPYLWRGQWLSDRAWNAEGFRFNSQLLLKGPGSR